MHLILSTNNADFSSSSGRVTPTSRPIALFYRKALADGTISDRSHSRRRIAHCPVHIGHSSTGVRCGATDSIHGDAAWRPIGESIEPGPTPKDHCDRRRRDNNNNATTSSTTHTLIADRLHKPRTPSTEARGMFAVVARPAVRLRCDAAAGAAARSVDPLLGETITRVN